MSSEQQKKDLILAVIANYKWEDIKPFFLSLKKTGYSGEVALFIENIDIETQEILKNLGMQVTLIPFQRVGLENLFNINDYRYYLYRNFLETNRDLYNNVLITDVRDVFFQVNPSFAGWSKECITVAKEPIMMKNELWTTRWILQKFGYHIYSQVESKTVICSGTTYGPADQIVNYLNEMYYHLYYLNYFPPTVTDQAVHNYLVYFSKINPIAFSDNDNGPIMTIGYEHSNNIHINDQKQVLLKNGNIAPIIHQYDRHQHLVHLFRSLST